LNSSTTAQAQLLRQARDLWRNERPDEARRVVERLLRERTLSRNQVLHENPRVVSEFELLRRGAAGKRLPGRLVEIGRDRSRQASVSATPCCFGATTARAHARGPIFRTVTAGDARQACRCG